MRDFRSFGVVGGVAVALSVALSGCVIQPESDGKIELSGMLSDVALAAERSYDYEAAARHFITLYSRDRDDTEALVGLARNLRYVGSPKEAIKALKQGIRDHGELPALLVELGKAQIAAALIGDARETLDKSLKADPENWQAHSALGVIYDRLGLFEAARAAYRKALELSPNNVAVINNLGLSLALSGKLDEAIRTLEKLRNSEYSTLQARQNLAMLYGLKGDFENAEKLSLEDLPAKAAADNVAALKRLHR